jgi:hypothetical protein
MLKVVAVCQWWYSDERAYRRDTTNPECPLESADSSRNDTLFPFQLPTTNPAFLPRPSDSATACRELAFGRIEAGPAQGARTQGQRRRAKPNEPKRTQFS